MTNSHVAELTAVLYNPCNRDGYSTVMSMLKKHGDALNFISAKVGLVGQHSDPSEVLSDFEGLAWQVRV